MEKTFERLRDIIKKEMDALLAPGELDENSLACLYKMVDIVKDMGEIETQDSGYSQMYPMEYSMNSYRGNNSYRGGNSYGRGNSYRGNNSYRNGYSRNDEMMNRMQQMMNEAQSEQERDVIRRMMDTM